MTRSVDDAQSGWVERLALPGCSRSRLRVRGSEFGVRPLRIDSFRDNLPFAMQDQEFLAQFLKDRDAFCPACKYNLRNLTVSTCPECGESLVLSIACIEPRQAGPIAGLICLCMGLGFSFLMAVYGAISSVIRDDMPDELWSEITYHAVIPAAILVVLTVLWLKNWNRIRRAPTVARWTMVGLTFILIVVNVLQFTFFIRA
jgi:predicted RNA-binding Zn-ribbon protein involved in translation (DUF1610 family)